MNRATLWAGILLATPLSAWSQTCPGLGASATHQASARDGMPWVGRMDLVVAPATRTFCPADDSQDYDRGLLFELTDADCPSGCVSDGPASIPTVAPSASPSSDRLTALDALPAQLARYCMYTPAVTNPDPPEFSGGDITLLDRSMMVVAASADPADLETYYEQRSREQIGMCELTEERDHEVRLVLLDSAATAVGDPTSMADPLGHGATLADIVSDLTCPEADCPFDLYSRIAMPLQESSTGDVEWNVLGGGAFGSREWLAQAVVREVHAWEASDAGALVLNLSLAWHGDWGGQALLDGDESCEPTDVLAVYDALRYARCHGALIVASAGNRTGDGTDDDNMFPAAWAALTVDASECDELFGVTAAAVQSSGSPILYVASGATAGDQPLATSRPDAQPWFTAYAERVTTGSRLPMTGSSVAAAIVSSEAARAWLYDASLDPDDVMSVVWSDASQTAQEVTGVYAEAEPTFASETTARRVGGTCLPTEDPSGLDWTACGTTLTCPNVTADSTLSADPFGDVATGPTYEPFTFPTPIVIRCPSCTITKTQATPDDWTLVMDLSTVGSVVGPVHLATRTAPGQSWTMYYLGDDIDTGTFIIEDVDSATTQAAVLFHTQESAEGYHAHVTLLEE